MPLNKWPPREYVCIQSINYLCLAHSRRQALNQTIQHHTHTYTCVHAHACMHAHKGHTRIYTTCTHTHYLTPRRLVTQRFTHANTLSFTYVRSESCIQDSHMHTRTLLQCNTCTHSVPGMTDLRGKQTMHTSRKSHFHSTLKCHCVCMVESIYITVCTTTIQTLQNLIVFNKADEHKNCTNTIHILTKTEIVVIIQILQLTMVRWIHAQMDCSYKYLSKMNAYLQTEHSHDHLGR